MNYKEVTFSANVQSAIEGGLGKRILRASKEMHASMMIVGMSSERRSKNIEHCIVMSFCNRWTHVIARAKRGERDILSIIEKDGNFTWCMSAAEWTEFPTLALMAREAAEDAVRLSRHLAAGHPKTAKSQAMLNDIETLLQFLNDDIKARKKPVPQPTQSATIIPFRSQI